MLLHAAAVQSIAAKQRNLKIQYIRFRFKNAFEISNWSFKFERILLPHNKMLKAMCAILLLLLYSYF